MEKVKGIRFNVATGQTEEFEEEVELPNPRVQEIQNRLQEIRQELAQGDWLTVKYTENAIDEVSFQKHKEHRALLRDEYNDLDDELSQL